LSPVSALSPSRAPRVLEDPVVLAVVAAVTDDENSMVQVALVASLIVEEPSGVELEFVGGIDGDGDWAGLSNGVSEGIFAARLNEQLFLVTFFSICFFYYAELNSVSTV
jgi:hypothetical protein